MYDVEFLYGATKPYSANIISENIHNSVDLDGLRSRPFGEILNYCKIANAVAISDATYVGRNGWRYQRHTIAGCNLLIGMKDGSEQWYPFKDMKQYCPFQVAEYAFAKGISRKPAFSWWVHYTIKKRNVIIAAIKSRLKVATNKYGV